MVRFNLKENTFTRLVPYLLFFVISFTIIAFQIHFKVTILKTDAYFHYSRFYDAAQQIKNGNVSLFQMNYSFFQTGRFVNVLYGPIFAYLMGFILLISGTFYKFQIITTFLITLITVGGMYKCLDYYWPKNIVTNSLISCTYLAASSPWNDNTSFHSISAMLCPMVLYAGLRMIFNNEKPIDWIQLGIIMAIVFQIHILSVVIFSIMLAIFFFIGLSDTSNRKNMLLNLLWSIVLCLLLTVNIWYIIIYFHTVDKTSYPISVDISKNTFGIYHILIILIPQLIYVCTHLKESKINNVVTGSALILTFIISKFFPWGFVQTEIPILKEIFQYPSRLVVIIYALMATGISITCYSIENQHNKNKNIVAIIFLFISFVSNYSPLIAYSGMNAALAKMLENENLQIASKTAGNYTNTLDLITHYFYPEYLPKAANLTYKEKENIFIKQIENRSNLFDHKVLPNAKLQLSWHSSKKEETVLPIIMYKNSKLEVNGRDQIIHKNEMGIPTIKAKKGQNIAILSYNPPSVLIISFIITSFGWIVILSILFTRI